LPTPVVPPKTAAVEFPLLGTPEEPAGSEFPSSEANENQPDEAALPEGFPEVAPVPAVPD
jgi:hypothetical protein